MSSSSVWPKSLGARVRRLGWLVCGPVCLGALVSGGGAAPAQEGADPRLPEAARLALRARPGDTIKMDGGRKITTHIHLEAISSDFSTETDVKDSSSFSYRGPAPNGAMVFEARESSRATVTNVAGTPMKPIVATVSGIFTIRPNLDVIKATGLSSKKGGKQSSQVAPASPSLFGPVRFPDKPLRAGDRWSGSAKVTEASELKGITINYDSTLAGFEMYQSFPCARVETQYSYKGLLPGIEASVKKQLGAGAKVSGTGELTGSETTYYVLDRGWPLNDQAKFTVALNITVTAKGQTLEVGGTIDSDNHAAVTGYPAYAPALVPKVAASP